MRSISDFNGRMRKRGNSPPRLEYQSWCRSCSRAEKKIWARNNRDKINAYRKEFRKNNLGSVRIAERRVWLHRHYGLSLHEFDNLMIEQGGACAICKKVPKPIKGKLQPLYVDHDHTTGIVRGLLCHNCNHGLGHFFDSSEFLLNAVSYLKGEK